MTSLPVIIGFGGISSAGRSSAHHAYRRTVLENLPAAQQAELLAAATRLLRDDVGLQGTFDYPHHTVVDRCGLLDP